MPTDTGAADRAADRVVRLLLDIRAAGRAFSRSEHRRLEEQAGDDCRRWHAIKGELGIGYDERRELTALIAGIIAEEMGR